MIEEKEKANKLRQLSKKVEEADDFEDTEEGVARGGVGAVNVAKYSLPQSPPNLHIPASLSWRVEIPWSVKAVSSSSVHQSRLLHSPQAICTIPASSPLVTTTSRPSLRSACHDDSVVHLYQSRFKIARPAGPQTRFGAVMDTGAQRGATANVDDIVKITDETLTMQCTTSQIILLYLQQRQQQPGGGEIILATQRGKRWHYGSKEDRL